MRKGKCKHYKGTINKMCDAQVFYSDVTPDPKNMRGFHYRLPCIKEHQTKRDDLEELIKNKGRCPCYQEPTEEEIKDFQEYVDARVGRMMKAMPMVAEIKKEFKGQSMRGKKTCIICGGVFHFTHASYNGHVHGKCETDECLAFME